MTATRRAQPAAQAFDPLRSETFGHLFAAVAEEMGATLRRSAFSINVKERRDYSCALFDATGVMVAQAAHLPVHLGSAPLSVRAAIAHYGIAGFAPTDAVLLNDPFAGGTHLPDLTLVQPVFLAGARTARFFVANRAHHADVGGPHPGSMGPARDVHGEGLRVPPVKLVRAGVMERDLLNLFLANVRGRDEREGDLFAQWASLRLGARRLGELADEFGAQELERRAADQLEWGAREARAMLATWPAGTYAAEAEIERGGPVLRVRLVFAKGRLRVDLSGCDDQVDEPLNCPRAVAVSALLYVLRLFCPPSLPTSEGLLAPVDLVTRPGSVVDARYPAPVAAGNVETSQRLVDVLLDGFAAADPARVPAGSAGTMSNFSFGVAGGHGAARTYYETLGGGAGGGPRRAGASALQTHMTNTRNTPVEAFEREFPVRVQRLGVRRDSGGAGARAGGDGLVKELLFLAPARVGWLATQQHGGGKGRLGGADGAQGCLRPMAVDGALGAPVGSVAALDVPAGGGLRIETPGGGGHGAAPRGARRRRANHNSLVRPPG